MASRILTSARRFESLAYRILRHKSTSVVLSETDLQLLNKYNKSPILSDVLKSFQCFASQAPKGFEKFFKDKPKPGPKKRAEKSSSKKELLILEQTDRRPLPQLDTLAYIMKKRIFYKRNIQR